MSTPDNKDDENLSDEEWRKLLKPDPSVEEMIDVVKANFCEPGDDRVEIVKELDSYDDRNFWMRISGVDHLVKVHNGVESGDACKSIEHKKQDSAIHYQYAIMKTLRDNGITASFPVQLEDAAKNRDPFVHTLPVVSKKHSPRKLVVSVYTWVEGTTMASFKVCMKVKSYLLFLFFGCLKHVSNKTTLLFSGCSYCHWNALQMQEVFWERSNKS
jgi:hypothetical protein